MSPAPSIRLPHVIAGSIIISVHYGIRLPSQKQAMRDLLKATEVDESKYVLTQAGFKKYSLGSEDLFIKDDLKSGFFYVVCNPDEPHIASKLCSVHENYGDSFSLEFYFDKADEEKSYEINKKVLCLLDSFRIDTE